MSQNTVVRFKMDGQEASIDMEKLLWAEAREIERLTGQTFKEVSDLLKRGSLTAMQALVFVTFKRERPGFKFSDLDQRSITDVEVVEDGDVDDVNDSEDPQLPEGGRAE